MLILIWCKIIIKLLKENFTLKKDQKISKDKFYNKKILLWEDLYGNKFVKIN